MFLRIPAITYCSGRLILFHHRYHIVWAPKYRYNVRIGDVRLPVRNIIRQVSDEMGVNVVSGALARDHVHMFVEIPPHVSVSQFVQSANRRSSPRIQKEFEHIRKCYWGQRFWARCYFSDTSGNITDNVITAYFERHRAPNQMASASRNESTGVSQ